MPRPPSWTDADLIAAVAASTCFKEVCDALGLWPGGGTYRTLERHIQRLGIDASHLARRLGPRGPRTRRRRWVEDELVDAVRESRSLSEVARRLGYNASGGVHRYLKAHIVKRNLDTSHFAGQAWANGKRFPGRRARPLEEVLTDRSTYHSWKLKRRLLAAGLLEPRCARCGLHEWQGEPIVLELDHVNGAHTDNRLANLRLLCPNCHSLTETYAGRRRG